MALDDYSLLLATLACSAGGAALAFVVDLTLYEISVSRTFALRMALVFLALGTLVLGRALTSSEDGRLKKTLWIAFSTMTLLSGVACLVLEENFVALSPIAKVPLYTLLGVSLSFSLTSVAIDLVNFAFSSKRKTLLITEGQVFVFLIGSIFTGLLYGVVFGALDVGEAAASDDQKGNRAFVKDELISIPIGALVGLAVGLVHRQLGSEMARPKRSKRYESNV